ncbi:acyl-CoA dehydrogenase family protein [Streptomyces roseicoloratus]|uniref:acyl-CoA dehydrogenase family protein n=1 Tax=Streptomyces roseicoloratus TaxID=2508722 RepID=UPI001009DE60|nr:acyl-CoA dehydrogenase family protein [Streptomyces roseicoloratus]
MDFTPTEEQQAARELAARVFGDLSTHERLAAAGTGTDAELWKALCAAGLPGAVEEVGLLGLVLMAEEQGRTTAQVPFTASCVYGLLAVARHGTEDQRARLLPGLRDGSAVATGAFPAAGVFPVASASPAAGASSPAAGASSAAGAGAGAGALRAERGAVRAESDAVRAESDAVRAGSDAVRAEPGAVRAEPGNVRAEPSPVRADRGQRLAGSVAWVPWLRDATHVLVPDEQRALWLVRTEDAGPAEDVELTAPWSAGRLVLDRTPGERVGGPGAYDDVLAAARIAFAGLQAGVCAGSLARAVAYTSVREQFGRPLSSHQAVQLRAADAHMDTESIRVTAYEAAWRYDQALPAAAHALTAAWWASEAGKRVVHAGQHLHGGMGADLGHPVHRHFLWGRQLDAYLGCGTELLAELGDLLAKGEAA